VGSGLVPCPAQRPRCRAVTHWVWAPRELLQVPCKDGKALGELGSPPHWGLPIGRGTAGWAAPRAAGWSTREQACAAAALPNCFPEKMSSVQLPSTPRSLASPRRAADTLQPVAVRPAGSPGCWWGTGCHPRGEPGLRAPGSGRHGGASQPGQGSDAGRQGDTWGVGTGRSHVPGQDPGDRLHRGPGGASPTLGAGAGGGRQPSSRQPPSLSSERS